MSIASLVEWLRTDLDGKQRRDLLGGIIRAKRVWLERASGLQAEEARV